MPVNLKQIAAARNVNYDTTCKHIKALIKEGKFVKKTYGKQYSFDEVKQLEKLLGFKFKELK